jgi:hypothetical protein
MLGARGAGTRGGRRRRRAPTAARRGERGGGGVEAGRGEWVPRIGGEGEVPSIKGMEMDF